MKLGNLEIEEERVYKIAKLALDETLADIDDINIQKIAIKHAELAVKESNKDVAFAYLISDILDLM